MAADDTRPGDLDGARRRHKYMQFSPEINAGHLLQVLVLALGGVGLYGTVQAERAAYRLELDQVKRDAASEAVRTKETLVDLKTEMRKVQESLIELNLNLVRMNAQQGGKEHGR